MRMKKFRGLKRSIRKFYKDFEEETRVFPTDFEGYYEYHLPDNGAYWLNSSKVSYKLKSECFQFLIDRTKHLIDLKPAKLEAAKVVLMIDFHYWYSTKIYIYNEPEEVEFEQNDGNVSIVKPENFRDFAKEWNVKIPPGLDVIGTKSKVINKDYFFADIYGGETWYIGHL
ncbi:DUF3916 domain-containing protein [Bacillus sp. ISL-18]|uniref:DUF3916 domain-containing protein n=1 Tax=Bacillus sp. ISL-18 TaxID=2819118 RepID=UPI001BEA09B9|nr:DUF3916 domain-containing protein [Bacillus sp. ISL-18]MBT2659300.1 DUF3916 domain-containing protein [Bacillus sp. ISL-18]